MHWLEGGEVTCKIYTWNNTITNSSRKYLPKELLSVGRKLSVCCFVLVLFWVFIVVVFLFVFFAALNTC